MTFNPTHPIHPAHGLGRIFRPDPRDLDHHFGLHLAKLDRPELIPPTCSRIVNWVGDQRDTSECVGFSWAGFMRAQPLAFTIPPLSIYNGAKRLDPYPGEEYDGTTVRAGGKYLLSMHDFAEYVWTLDMQHIKQWIYYHAPVVVGTNWYKDMFTPEPIRSKIIHGSPAPGGRVEHYLHPTGSLEGGHAWLIYGYDDDQNFFRMVNSWGRSWAAGGRAVITYNEFQRLFAEDGEACSAIKVKLARTKEKVAEHCKDSEFKFDLEVKS